MSDRQIHAELAELFESYPEESEPGIGDYEQSLRDRLYESLYDLNVNPRQVAFDSMAEDEKRNLHKELRFGPAFQYALTREEGDMEEIHRMNLEQREKILGE